MPVRAPARRSRRDRDLLARPQRSSRRRDLRFRTRRCSMSGSVPTARGGGNSSPARRSTSSRSGSRVEAFPVCLSSGQPALWRHVPASTGWIMANTWHAHFHVTGSHNFKAGYNGLYDNDNQQSNFANRRARVSVQQRRAESDLGALRHVRQPVANQIRRLLRAGPVDVEQVDCRRAPHDHAFSYYPASHIGGTRSFRSPRSSRKRTESISRTSRRESAPPTICSGTGRRR